MVSSGNEGCALVFKMKRHKHRPRKHHPARWTLLLLVIAVSFWLVRSETRAKSTVHPESTAFPAVPVGAHRLPPAAVARTIYPYSVVPGGIASVAELKAAMAADPVVAAHYANFDATKAHVVRAAAARFVYVSYRRGAQVYWTRRQLELANGENLITDGVITARFRCANQISAVPRSPTADEDPKDLDTPETPAVQTSSIAAADSGWFDAADWGALVSEKIPGPARPSEPGSGNAPTGSFPVFVPLAPSSGGEAPNLPSVVQVPEPSTLLLLLTSFPALWALRKRKV
jgi:hypothetical protein